MNCCISSYSYIKPQPSPPPVPRCVVVYHPIPTSNHNRHIVFMFLQMLYIILFLHQTTTGHDVLLHPVGCISSYSYIKPQPGYINNSGAICCISSYSYIKPQLVRWCSALPTVVYHPIPTSNHNLRREVWQVLMLYIILFLHQTTT